MAPEITLPRHRPPQTEEDLLEPMQDWLTANLSRIPLGLTLSDNEIWNGTEHLHDVLDRNGSGEVSRLYCDITEAMRAGRGRMPTRLEVDDAFLRVAIEAGKLTLTTDHPDFPVCTPVHFSAEPGGNIDHIGSVLASTSKAVIVIAVRPDPLSGGSDVAKFTIPKNEFSSRLAYREE